MGSKKGQISNSKGKTWKLSESDRLNRVTNRLGKVYNNEQKKKLSEAKKGLKNPKNLGSLNNRWKGGVTKIPEYRSWMKNKRNRLKRVSIGSHTYKEWQELKKFYNFMCLCCKKFEPEIKLTEDHIIPISLNGSDNIENIQPLCRSCNSKKNNKIIKYEK